jgi:hypothetical protein
MSSQFGFKTTTDLDPFRNAVLREGSITAKRIDPIVRTIFKDLKQSLRLKGEVTGDLVGKPSIREAPGRVNIDFGIWKLGRDADEAAMAPYAITLHLLGVATPTNGAIGFLVNVEGFDSDTATRFEQAVRTETGLTSRHQWITAA